MTNNSPTPLEAALLDGFRDKYRAQGFPATESVRVRSRRNTGAGRLVELECPAPISLKNGYYDLGYCSLEMEGVSDGLMVVVAIEGGRLTDLEIATYGPESWDGEERSWKLVKFANSSG